MVTLPKKVAYLEKENKDLRAQLYKAMKIEDSPEEEFDVPAPDGPMHQFDYVVKLVTDKEGESYLQIMW